MADGRYPHSMVHDSSEFEITLYGGLYPTTIPIGYFGDTWKMRNNVWSKIRDICPASLYAADMVYTGKRAVFFGGADGQRDIP